MDDARYSGQETGRRKAGMRQTARRWLSVGHAWVAASTGARNQTLVVLAVS